MSPNESPDRLADTMLDPFDPAELRPVDPAELVQVMLTQADLVDGEELEQFAVSEVELASISFTDPRNPVHAFHESPRRPVAPSQKYDREMSFRTEEEE